MTNCPRPSKKMCVYLAGPDVFEPNPIDVGMQLKAIAEAHGFIPMYPFDNVVDPNSPSASMDIFLANRTMIDNTDLVIANLNAFRGAEPDSGTVWEIGYAIGRGIPVIAYVATAESMRDRVLRIDGKNDVNCCIDRNGKYIEDFGHPLNLMLMHSVHALVIGDFTAACSKAAEFTKGRH